MCAPTHLDASVSHVVVVIKNHKGVSTTEWRSACLWSISHELRSSVPRSVGVTTLTRASLALLLQSFNFSIWTTILWPNCEILCIFVQQFKVLCKIRVHKTLGNTNLDPPIWFGSDICVCVCMYYVYVCIHICIYALYGHIHIHMYMYMYSVCIYIIYIHICVYI